MSDALRPLPRRILETVARRIRRPKAADGAGSDGIYQPCPRRVHVVCYEPFDGWILGKMARRLCEALEAESVQVSLGKEQDPSCDINHHIIYFDYLEQKVTPETVMITHIDNERELAKVRRQLTVCGVELGICMSREALERLAQFGIPRQRLAVIGPAHDGVAVSRKTRIGLTTRLYPDGCKREHLLSELAARVSPGEFAFVIMGAGWHAIVEEIRGRGFDVQYFPAFDYDVYRTLFATMDYYLYLGLDEGSMGLLDALAAGVPTIVTPQGFHLDIPDGITHAFTTTEELAAVCDSIAEVGRRRARAVADLTWSAYARKHMVAWDYVTCLANGGSPTSDLMRAASALGIHQA